MTQLLTISSRQKQAVSTARMNDIDAATTPGKFKCYAAPRPTAGGSPTGALLATFTLTDPCGTVDASGLHVTTLAPAQVTTGGVIDWGRFEDGDGTYCMDGNVRMSTDSDVATASFIVDNSTVLYGGFVALVSATIAEGG